MGREKKLMTFISAWQFYLVSDDTVLWWQGHLQSTGFHMDTTWCCLLYFRCSNVELRCLGPAGGYPSPHCPALSSLQPEKTFSQHHLQEILVDPQILLSGILSLSQRRQATWAESQMDSACERMSNNWCQFQDMLSLADEMLLVRRN